jgi:hypothetical protein
MAILSPVSNTDTFVVGKVNAKLINASPERQAKVINGAAGKLFYKNAANVSTSDTEIAAGASVTFEEVVWVISNSQAKVTVEYLAGPTVQDFTVSDDLTIKDTLTVTGVTTLTGGTATPSAVPGFYTGQWAPTTATSGTDTTPAEKKLFVASIFIPVNKTVKGIGYLVGSVGGTNKVVAGLFSATGTLLAKTTETAEGTTAGTAAEIQEINLTSEYAAVGPANYFIGITMNGNTARLRTIPKNTIGSNLLSKEITLAEKNKLANITAPTSLESDKGPIAWVF